MSDNNIDIEKLQNELKQKDDLLKDLQKQFEAVKAKSDELLHETKKAKEKARAEAEEKARLEQAAQAQKGDFEQLYKSSETQRKELEQKIKEMHDRYSSEKQRAEALRLASELAEPSNPANAELLSEFINKRIKYTDEGVKVLDQNGELTVSSLEDLKKEFANSDKYKALLRGNQSNGGGAAGSSDSVAAAKEISKVDFQKMKPPQQMKFIVDGGKVLE